MPLRGAMLFILRQWRYSPVALYASAFLMACILAELTIVWPWRVVSLGGDKIAIGATFGLFHLTYIFSCLVIRPHADWIGVKKLVVAACVLTAICSAALIPVASITVLLVIIGVQGVVLGSFWPPLTGWLSAGHKGTMLNRRLSIFNFSWATGQIAGCGVAGYLFGVRSWLPFAFAAAVSSAIVLLAAVVHKHREAANATDTSNDVCEHPEQAQVYLRMARVGLVATYVGLGLLRGPIVSVLKGMTANEVSGAEALSWFVGIASATMMGTFLLLGRTVRWHFKLWPLLGAQVIAAILVAMVGWTDSLVVVGVCLVAAAPLEAMSYSSHAYYALSGSSRRSSAMAVHEVLLAAGIVVGSMGGGALASWMGLPAAYAIGGAIGLAAVAIQIGIYLAAKRSKNLLTG